MNIRRKNICTLSGESRGSRKQRCQHAKVWKRGQPLIFSIDGVQLVLSQRFQRLWGHFFQT
jgi:hypothetical protein